MKKNLHKLAPVLAATHIAFAGWMRLAGSGALNLAVFALEIWLRVPVRPVLNQLRTARRTAPAARQNAPTCRLWAFA